MKYPKQWLAWIAKLLPTQKAHGDHAVQVGKVSGVLHVDHSTHSHTQHNNHVTIIQSHKVHPMRAAYVSPVAAQPTANFKPQGLAPLPDCADVLRRMDKLRHRTRVLDFMDREFGTRLVIDLTPEQLFRTSKYLDVVLQDPRNLKTRRRQ